MNKDQLKAKRKKLSLTQAELGKLVGVSARTIQGWEYGTQRIPKTLEDFLDGKISKLTLKNDESEIVMDVSSLQSLTMSEMVEFCLRKENKEKFLDIPSIKLLIDLNRNEAKAELMEKHIILKSSNSGSKTKD